MTLNSATYKRAAYPRSLQESNPRVFLVRWNNTRARRGGEERFVWREAWGCLFPNGRVVMDFGPCYETLSDMRMQLERQGSVEMHWLDEIEQEEKPCR